MKKIIESFKRNLVLTVVLILVLLGAGIAAWNMTLCTVIGLIEPINCMEVQKDDSEVGTKKDLDEIRFEYTDAGVIYHPQVGSDAGPFQYIYENDFYYSWKTIARYIGDNGKYGYLNSDGSLLTEPIFINAAKFENGTARVQEKQDRIYYIDTQGNRITQDYLDGSLNFQMQGNYCIVQMIDGKFGIINRRDEMIFSGADSIEDLPTVTTLGSAVVDGCAVLFALDPSDGEEEFKIIERFDSFSRISYVYSGDFAFVWDDNGYMGAIDYRGKIIVPANYQSVEYEYLGDDFSINNLVFLAHDENGAVHVIKAREEM